MKNMIVLSLMLVSFLLFASGCRTFGPPYCSKVFLNEYQTALDSVNLSFCYTFHIRGYEGFKGEPACRVNKTEILSTSNCIIGMADASQNLSLCSWWEMVVDGTVELPNLGFGDTWGFDLNKCFSKIHNLMNNPKLCDDIITKTSCYAYIAAERNNLSMCEAVGGVHSHGANCITPIAIKRNNLSICYKMIRGKYETFSEIGCIIDLAVATNNRTVCLNFTDEEWRDVCLRRVNE